MPQQASPEDTGAEFEIFLRDVVNRPANCKCRRDDGTRRSSTNQIEVIAQTERLVVSVLFP